MGAQIPEVAMKVVEVLRRDVPKPKDLPVIVVNSNKLRWKNYCGNFCPMGLHPKAMALLPYDKFDFPIDDLTNQEIIAFAKWWDSQTDAQAAVDTVWGKNEHTNT